MNIISAREAKQFVTDLQKQSNTLCAEAVNAVKDLWVRYPKGPSAAWSAAWSAAYIKYSEKLLELIKNCR